MSERILFVCLGNICRSPTAEGVVRAIARRRGVALTLDSAGTANWHSGKPPYEPMQKSARLRGYDLSDLRARQVTANDFDRFDRIIAMDAENRSDLEAMRTGDGVQISLFTDYAPHLDADHVPDPYFTRDFDGALQLIEACAEGLLDDLETKQ